MEKDYFLETKQKERALVYSSGQKWREHIYKCNFEIIFIAFKSVQNHS